MDVLTGSSGDPHSEPLRLAVVQFKEVPVLDQSRVFTPVGSPRPPGPPRSTTNRALQELTEEQASIKKVLEGTHFS